MDGRPDAEYQTFFESREAKFTKTPEGGENYTNVKNRMTEFLYDIDSKNEGKNILIVSHNTPIWLMFGGALGFTPKELMAIRVPGTPFIHNSEVMKLDFAPIPHNRNYELDLHRPFIDELTLKCKKCGSIMKRIPEVFDCWFESGSMPYAEMHYPFENLDTFNPKKNLRFPADFIAEGLDQTRGWFYSMLVLSVGLFGESSYKNVIVNGTILAENGQKMSKRLKNYTDPMDVVTQYSADAMRYYLLSSPSVEAEDMKFSDKGVDEVLKKVIMRVQNVFSFLEMYGKESKVESRKSIKSENVLDKWVLIRLKELATTITKFTETYELDRASRPIADFVDELSTWYVRRSRDRFKSENVEDRNAAINTTKNVLLQFSKLIAPSMPFVAEDIYLKTGGEKESVHLESWPEELVGELSKSEEEIIENMKEVLKTVTSGLEARAKAGIKVRQPLASLKIKLNLLKEFTDLIKDEVNVKEVVCDESIENAVELDLNISEELKEEGIMRDVVRSIQELRKTMNLKPSDRINLAVNTNENGKMVFQKFSEEIKKMTNLVEVEFVSDENHSKKEFEIKFLA